MPVLTTTIEDPCPLIQYSSSGWSAGSSSDNQLNKYSQNNFMATTTDGASAAFTFNGTAVSIFGAKRDNHGPFTITIDGIKFPPIDGKSETATFQTALFSTSALQQGLHTVTLSNSGPTFVDIDFITWDTKLGADNDHLIVQSVQDTDDAFKYEPSVAWTTTPDRIGTFSGGSGHAVSTSPGASLTYNFEVRNGVQLFGPVGPSQSPYTVQIDGGEIRTFTAAKAQYVPQMLLYHADSLSAGKHVLKLVYQPSTPNQTFAIDYANVFRTSSTESNSASSNIEPSSSGLSAGATAGIVISILVILSSLAGLLFILRRRKRLLRDEAVKHLEGASAAQYEPQPYPFSQPQTDTRQANSGRARDITGAGPLRTNSTASAARTAVSFTSLGPSISMRLPSSPDRSHYGTASEYAGSSFAGNRYSAGASAATASSNLSGNSTNPRMSPETHRRTTKGQLVLMPPSAGQSLEGVPEDELRNNRLEVAGREQDFGALATSPTTLPLAPPDYHQATEPYVLQAR